MEQLQTNKEQKTTVSTRHQQIISLSKHSLKIKDYDSSTIDEMNKRLKVIAYSIGIKEKILDGVMLVIDKFLIKHYGNLSMQELSLAFDIWALEKKFEHYNSFSIDFISSVAKEFMQYQKEAIKLQKQKDATKLIEDKYTEATPEQCQTHYTWVIEAFVEKGRLPTADYVTLFNWAEKTGLIKMTRDEKKDMMEHVIEKIKVSDQSRSKIKDILNSPKELKLECRIESMKQHFLNL